MEQEQFEQEKRIKLETEQLEKLQYKRAQIEEEEKKIKYQQEQIEKEKRLQEKNNKELRLQEQHQLEQRQLEQRQKEQRLQEQRLQEQRQLEQRKQEQLQQEKRKQEQRKQEQRQLEQRQQEQHQQEQCINEQNEKENDQSLSENSRQDIMESNILQNISSQMQKYISRNLVSYDDSLIIYFLNKYEELFANYVSNKCIALVGPASSIIGSNKGPVIDKFDLVVRLNKALPLPENLKNDIGSRTDIIYNSLNTIDYPGENNLSTRLYKKHNVQFVCSSYPIRP
jgi:hypothetical protein